MRFKEANMKDVACSDYSVCPTAHARCCLFCNEDCEKLCDIAKIWDHQPQSWKDMFNCPHLVDVKDIAWKLILGTDIEVVKE